MPNFLATSNLHKKVNSHLIEPVNAMTTFFFRRSVEKAFQLDEAPADLTLNPTKPLGSNPPFITSAVDDHQQPGHCERLRQTNSLAAARPSLASWRRGYKITFARPLSIRTRRYIR